MPQFYILVQVKVHNLPKLSSLKKYLHFRTKKSTEGDIVLTLDAGDWYSGSLFDNLGADLRTPSIPQMEFFHAAQYDGIILGSVIMFIKF